jgi:FkbM family methyltransferase
VYILNQAIGWPEGWATAHIDPTSSVSTLTPYQHRDTSGRKVRVLSLDSVLDLEGFDTVDFMKIDIEGAELLLLESTEWLEKTKTFLVECHSEEAIERYKNLEGFRVEPLLDDPAWGNHLFAKRQI